MCSAGGVCGDVFCKRWEDYILHTGFIPARLNSVCRWLFFGFGLSEVGYLIITSVTLPSPASAPTLDRQNYVVAGMGDGIGRMERWMKESGGRNKCDSTEKKGVVGGIDIQFATWVFICSSIHINYIDTTPYIK